MFRINQPIKLKRLKLLKKLRKKDLDALKQDFETLNAKLCNEQNVLEKMQEYNKQYLSMFVPQQNADYSKSFFLCNDAFIRHIEEALIQQNFMIERSKEEIEIKRKELFEYKNKYQALDDYTQKIDAEYTYNLGCVEQKKLDELAQNLPTTKQYPSANSL